MYVAFPTDEIFLDTYITYVAFPTDKIFFTATSQLMTDMALQF